MVYQIIKAVIMDIDGSILVDRQIPLELSKLISKTKSLYWIVNSGRNFNNIGKTSIVEYINPETPQIIESGSKIVNFNKYIYRRHILQSSEIDNLFRQLNSDILKNINYIFFTIGLEHGVVYSPKRNFRVTVPYSKLATDLNQFKNLIYKNSVTKITINSDEPLNLIKLNCHLNGFNTDITTAGVDKGSAYIEVLNFLKLTPQETLFIFNDNNDLPVVNHNKLKGITLLKVGNRLPEIEAHHYVSDPKYVTQILKEILDIRN